VARVEALERGAGGGVGSGGGGLEAKVSAVERALGLLEGKVAVQVRRAEQAVREQRQRAVAQGVAPREAARVAPKGEDHRERIARHRAEAEEEEVRRLAEAHRENQEWRAQTRLAATRESGGLAPAGAAPEGAAAEGGDVPALEALEAEGGNGSRDGVGAEGGARAESADEVRAQARAAPPRRIGTAADGPSQDKSPAPSPCPATSAAAQGFEGGAAMQLQAVGRDEGGGESCVCWEGKGAVSGGSDGRLRVWRSEAGAPASSQGLRGPRWRLAGEVLAHPGGVHSVRSLGEGRLVSGGEDGWVRGWQVDGEVSTSVVLRWSIDTREKQGGAHGEGESEGTGVTCVLAGNGDGRVYCGVETGSQVLVWERDGGEFVGRLRGHVSWVTGMELVLSETVLVTVSYDGSLRVWGVGNKGSAFFFEAARHTLATHHRPQQGLLCVVRAAWERAGGGEAVDEAGRARVDEVVTGSEGGEVDVWRVDSRGGAVEVTHVAGAQHSAGGGAEVAAVCAMDGRSVASGGADGRVVVWDRGHDGALVAAGEAMALPRGDGGAEPALALTGLALAPESGRVVVSAAAREEGAVASESVLLLETPAR